MSLIEKEASVVSEQVSDGVFFHAVGNHVVKDELLKLNVALLQQNPLLQFDHAKDQPDDCEVAVKNEDLEEASGDLDGHQVDEESHKVR